LHEAGAPFFITVMITSLRRALLLATACCLVAGLPAADKPDDKKKKADLTLEDVIFDAKYLKQVLGPNTLVAPVEKGGGIPTEAISKAGLAEKTKIFALPDEAVKPELKQSIPPSYPRSLGLTKEGIHARFLVFVGADGHVKSLYCYETTDQIFAIAVADAVIKWHYSPAKLGQTAVPVLVPVDMKFDESMADRNTFRNPRNPLSVQGNPVDPKPVRDNLPSGPP
jgi:hypothetical protein